MAITLPTNRYYSGLSNMINFIQQFAPKINRSEIYQKLQKAAGLYGSEALFRSMDIGETYSWEGDDEATKLLATNRNKTQKEQVISINKTRQTNVTIDHYQTKQAFRTDQDYLTANGMMLEGNEKAMNMFNLGRVNTFIGTYERKTGKQYQEVDMSDVTEPTTTEEEEAYNRIFAQRMVKQLRKIGRELKNPSRNYNDYGQMNTFDMNDLLVVWNGDVKDDLIYSGLSTMYNDELLKVFIDGGDELVGDYFGDKLTTGGTATGVEYSYVEGNFTGTDGILKHIYPGELLPIGATYLADEAYKLKAKGSEVICKIFPIDCLPNLSGFETGSMFWNPRSLTETHFKTILYNELETLKNLPWITVVKKVA